MRKVYHGSTMEIQSPLVSIGRKDLDFGEGFYVTDIRSQARLWAEIKSRYLMEATGIINEYACDFDSAISKYRYKHFEHYDREWLHFIVDNCRSISPTIRFAC